MSLVRSARLGISIQVRSTRSGAGQFPAGFLIRCRICYIELSNSSHISIESDKQPVSVHVDEAYSIWKDRPYSETASENFQTTSTNFQIMKSKLTEGISKAVQEMNLSRKEKLVKCYADTGILDAWCLV